MQFSLPELAPFLFLTAHRELIALKVRGQVGHSCFSN